MKVRFSIRGKLLTAAIAIVVLSFGIVWWFATQTARSRFETLSNDNLSLGADNLARTLRTLLEDARADAITTARLDLAAEPIDTGDPKNFEWYADELVTTKGRYAAMLVVNNEGAITGANANNRQGEEISPALEGNRVDETWTQRLAEAAQGSATWIEPCHPEAISAALSENERVVGYGVPIFDIMDDRIGTAYVFLSLTYLSEVISGYVTREDDALATLAIVVGADTRPLIVPSNLTHLDDWQESTFPILDQSNSYWESPEGESFQLVEIPLSESDALVDWRIVQLKSRTVAERAVSEIGTTLFLTFLLGLGLAVVSIMLIATKLLTPIRTLTATITKTKRAVDFQAMPITTNDEVGALTEAFNRVFKNLLEHETELEDKVKTRTEDLRQKMDALSRAQSQLQDAQTQLVQNEKMAALGELVAGIAHEINNPVNFVTSSFRISTDAIKSVETNLKSLLPDDEDGETAWQLFENDFKKIEESGKHHHIGTKRIQDIVRSLTAFARHDQAEFQSAQINDLLNETLVILSNKAKKITLHKDLGDVPAIDCFASQLSQVFLNVINNAIYAAASSHGENTKAEVYLKTLHEDDQIVVEISDNGPGLPPDMAEKIFDPFVTTKPVGEGTGMGLAISYKIITKHQGTIEATKGAHGGALFRIQIPTTTAV